MRYLSVLVMSLFYLLGPPAFADVPKILKVSEIQAGIEAIGFSVFKGVEPKLFNVVLLEPVDAMGAYLILIRISGGPMETPLEKIGAISGMSGSPIFIGCSDLDDCTKNGTLIGALSYSICVFCEGGPNAAMTPSEYMLGVKFGGYLATDGLSRRSLRKITDTSGWKNLMLMSGLQGSSSSNQLPRCSEFANSDIKPGSMITIFLAKGTMTAGVSGTVTWRDGDKIYAFGHPFTGSGKVNYPFSQISVADTLQSPVQASKIPGCELATHGALLMDGAFEVAGVVGQEVKLTPFDVHMFVGNRQTNLHEEIVYDSPMTTAILRLLPAAWASQVVGDLEDLPVGYQARIVIEDQPELFWRGVLPAEVFPVPFAELFNRVDNALQTIRKNSFHHQVESLHIDVWFRNDIRVWKKKDAFLSKAKALPGETVHIQIVLEDSVNGELKHISIPVRIPKDFADRMELGDPTGFPQISVLVQDGVHFVDPKDKAQKAPLTMETLIGRINKSMSPSANVLYVQQTLPRIKDKKEQDRSAAQSASVSVGKWQNMEANELDKLPSGEQFEILVEKAPALDDYIEFKDSFVINVDVSDKSKPDPLADGKPRRKWLGIF